LTAEVEGRDLGSVLQDLRARLDVLELPPGAVVDVVGSASDMAQAFSGLAFAIGLAVLLVYLILAAQFESFLQPFIILGAVPFAGAGAVLALVISGTPLSVVVLIGLIVLAGIVVNNAILLVDRANQLMRLEGLSALEAAAGAGRDRVRPIVMTTLTTVLALLPMLLTGGEGAELRAPLAVTVVGGLLGSTLLTLFVVPAACSLVGARGPEPRAKDATEC
jgi:HAE1 family hydrophobic/amphiphilic exporter-1